MWRVCVAVAIIVAVAAGCADDEDPKPGGTLVLQLLRPGEPLATVALPAGKPRIARGLAPAGGDPPLRLLHTGGRLVYYGAGGVYATDLELKGEPRKLGAAWYFVPSATDGRVWLAYPDRDERHVRALAEVTVQGRVTARSASPPPCPGPTVLGAVTGAVLCQDRSRLLAFDPVSGRVVRRLPGPFPLDTHGRLVAWCADGCPRLHVTDVRTGDDTAIEPGSRFRFDETYEGAFSPDGSLLAAPVVAGGRRRVALVDVAAGSVRVIAGSRLAGYRNISWSSSGWVLFNSAKGRIAAHAPGSGRTMLLPFTLKSQMLDMAAG
jgi:hypothetical protein